MSTNVLFKDETFWMTQKDMAMLFGVSLPSVSHHLKNIFESNELDESVVIAKITITTQHGALANKTQSSTAKLYNLDAIIAVGYRVNSKEPTQFRILAAKVLRKYIIKGFALNNDILNNIPFFQRIRSAHPQRAYFKTTSR